MRLTRTMRARIMRKRERLARVYRDQFHPDADRAAIVHYRLTRILWRHMLPGIDKFPDELEGA